VTSPKLTVIGLDAATFAVIDPLLEAGELPNLRRIFDRGSRGILRSTTPPLTSQAWATAFTGVTPPVTASGSLTEVSGGPPPCGIT
jgi:predicted AlkP superfamily phosphohydrolase/phosphomutase